MSSLAAARADNFYYPPDWDPNSGSEQARKVRAVASRRLPTWSPLAAAPPRLRAAAVAGPDLGGAVGALARRAGRTPSMAPSAPEPTRAARASWSSGGAAPRQREAQPA